VCGETTILFGENKLDFSAPFRKISMLDSVAFKTDRSTSDLMKRELLFDIAREHDVACSEQFSWGMMLALLFEHFVEKQLIQPTFITQFPTDISPLAKKNAHNPLFTDRF
jgi:lysyl-tRNA synthetase class 2